MRSDPMTLLASAVLVSATLVAGCARQAPPPADSPEARAELASRIAGLEIAGGSYEQTLHLGAELAIGSSEQALAAELGRALTEEERDRVRQVMREALAGIVSAEAFRSAVSEAYADRFSAAELQAISEFFASPAGSKLLSQQAGLTEEIGGAMESIVDENLERFISTVDEGLTAQFGEAATEGAQ